MTRRYRIFPVSVFYESDFAAACFVLTEFAQCHVRRHLDDGTPQSGLFFHTVRGNGNLTDTSSKLGSGRTVTNKEKPKIVFFKICWKQYTTH